MYKRSKEEQIGANSRAPSLPSQSSIFVRMTHMSSLDRELRCMRHVVHFVILIIMHSAHFSS